MMQRSPTSHIYFSQRLRLHYVDWGQHDAPAMVLVHGIQDHCRTWDDLAAHFYDRYHVIAPDLRGHGDSEWVKGSSYQYNDYLYDLHQLITQSGTAPVTLVGHSMGGSIVSFFAGVFPELVEKLVIIEGIGLWQAFNPKPPIDQALREWVSQTHELSARLPRRYAKLSDAYQRMQQANPQLSKPQALHLTAHGSNQNEDGSYSWKYDNYTHNFSAGSLSEDEVGNLWQKIDCPTLIVNASNGLEHRIGQDHSLDFFQNATLHTLPNTEHWTYHDDLHGVCNLLDNFLENPAN